MESPTHAVVAPGGCAGNVVHPCLVAEVAEDGRDVVGDPCGRPSEVWNTTDRRHAECASPRAARGGSFGPLRRRDTDGVTDEHLERPSRPHAEFAAPPWRWRWPPRRQPPRARPQQRHHPHRCRRSPPTPGQELYLQRVTIAPGAKPPALPPGTQVAHHLGRAHLRRRRGGGGHARTARPRPRWHHRVAREGLVRPDSCTTAATRENPSSSSCVLLQKVRHVDTGG
jgi:hypothetical protein